MNMRPLINFSGGGYTYRLSTEDTHLVIFRYEGRVIDAGTVSYSLSEMFFGRQTINPITIRLDNSDGYFNEFFHAVELRGMIIQITWRDRDAGVTLLDEYFITTSAQLTQSELILNAYNQSVDMWDTLIPPDVISETLLSSSSIDESALGKPVPIIMGIAHYCPLYSIYEDGAGVHDFLVGYGTITGVTEVLRDEMLVDSSEYTFYDGTQASPYPGYAFLRFISEQRDSSGELYEMKAAVTGIKIDGAWTNSGPLCFMEFLRNITWGLGQSVNTISFSDAVSKVGTYYDVSVCLHEQQKASDIRDLFLLALRYPYFYQGSSSQYFISVREYQDTNAQTFTKYNMKDAALALMSSDEYINELTLKFGYDFFKGTYELSCTESLGVSFGVKREILSPYTYYSIGAMVLCKYISNFYKYQDYILTFKTGMDGYALTLGDVILIDYPEIGIENWRMEIIAIDKSLDEISIKAASYENSIFM